MPGAKGRAGDVRNVMTKSIKASAQRQGQATIWHNSGEAMRPARPSPIMAVPDLVAVPSLPSPLPHPALARLCRLFDGVIAASSLVSNEPVLNVRDFDWTAGLRRQWRAIRDEALAVTGPAATSRIVPLSRGGETAIAARRDRDPGRGAGASRRRLCAAGRGPCRDAARDDQGTADLSPGAGGAA